VTKDQVSIRFLAEADAEKLSACFRRCYGDTYATALFYDPVEIRARMAAGRLEALVAVTTKGEIVGHMALTRRHTSALTVELGSAIVDPRYRGHGLLAQLGIELVERARSTGAVGYHHSQTTAHAIIQRATGEAGSVETGVMLAYIPAGTEYRELIAAPSNDRLAAVTVYQPLAYAPPRQVVVPRRYAPALQKIYERAGLRREGVDPGAGEIVSTSELETDFDSKRALLRVGVHRIGIDVSGCVGDLERAHPADVTQVDLLLTDPAIEQAVEDLRARGFFLCALLPEYAGSDVLRLQRPRAGNWTRPELFNPQAREILDAVLTDAESASGAVG